MVASFFVPKTGEDKNEVFAAKLVGFWSKSMRRPKKQGKRSSPKNQRVFSPNEDGDDQTK